MSDGNQAFPVVARAEQVLVEFKSGNQVLRALDHVSIGFTAGETTFVVGPSGCGKTTLLSVISATLRPTSGKVTVLDQPLDELTSKQKAHLRRRTIGFVFQQYNLLPALSALDNACVPLVADGVSTGEAARRVLPIFEELGIANLATRTPRQMSGGQQQRVAIARALAHQPQLLICDEPTAALDGAAGQATMTLFASVASNPERAVVVVTHDTRIFPFADRIVRMEDGRVVADERTVRGSTE